MYHEFVGRGWGAFDKVSAARLQKVSRPLNTVSCIRVASFVSLVKFGSSDVPFWKHSVGGNILEFAGGTKESNLINWNWSNYFYQPQ